MDRTLPLRRHLLTTVTVALCLSLGSCDFRELAGPKLGSGSGGAGAPSPPPVPPEPDANAATPNFVGTWAVSVLATSRPLCAGFTESPVNGTLIITKNGPDYTVFDGQITRPLAVTGNFATISFSVLGVTERWIFVVYHNDSLLRGSVDVWLGQCKQDAIVTGSRAAAR